MGKSTVVYDPNDIALAAFNKLMASPTCMAIIAHLQERQDWTAGNELTKLTNSPSVIKKTLKSLTAANVLSRMEKDGATLYRLDPDYFKRLSFQFNKLIDEIADGSMNNNL
ncbi:ArsR/SmtB family transcription factor [Mucilaginibacter phyllosphaerae]|uniref:DNA-binding transcriptional ArsR family regulator n=1 Tax=Mucilaginibacter phyllosphaerae TaxID=1812349 RepID=A0A4Y8AE57_9SPHI|nr:helix-turn-helix transcriptional regulator [Mucilaginibacter phyllosphaerae]MBB3971221.1 DNA-binding transcriptional ArsR family regulator [Mucilaginibacter phyllosphaerae]TEW66878.1 transcriptional regulator [Mucilaginibacter phyllosphaerae]GGH12505.1 hypothetical protein GCM10007352_19320 [Mucilaginibacter phyllosphaerae]